MFRRCIIKLGTPGTLFGFDVDTSHFSGNEAPEVSVDALYNVSADAPRHDDERVSAAQHHLMETMFRHVRVPVVGSSPEGCARSKLAPSLQDP
jgi:allantoicase